MPRNDPFKEFTTFKMIAGMQDGMIRNVDLAVARGIMHVHSACHGDNVLLIRSNGVYSIACGTCAKPVRVNIRNLVIEKPVIEERVDDDDWVAVLPPSRTAWDLVTTRTGKSWLRCPATGEYHVSFTIDPVKWSCAICREKQ